MSEINEARKNFMLTLADLLGSNDADRIFEAFDRYLRAHIDDLRDDINHIGRADYYGSRTG